MARDSDRTSLDPTTSTKGDDVVRSTGDQGPGGDAALRRIAGGGDTDTVPTFDQVLAEILGPLASEISPSDIPTEITAIAQEILQALLAEATALSSREPAAATDGGDHATAITGDGTGATTTGGKGAAGTGGKGAATTGGKGAAGTGGKGASTGAPAKTPDTPFIQLRDKLDALIAEKIASVIALTPKGKALADKFETFNTEHPGLIFEALLLAATAAAGRDAKIPELSHTFKIGDAWTVTAGAQLGSIRHIALGALNASIEYKKDKLDATAALSHDFAANSTTFNGQVTYKDLQFLHQTIDQALLSYKHVATDGKLPTDTIMEQVTFKLSDVGFKLAETNTWAEEKKAKAPSAGGGSGSGSGKGKGSGSSAASHTTPATPAQRVLTEKLTEEIALPAWNDYKLTLNAAQNFGPNHAANTFGANLQLPEIDKFKIALSGTETMGAGGSLGAKVTLPKFNDIGITLGETVPVGASTAKPQFSMDIDFKGVTLSIKQGTSTGSSTAGASSAVPNLGAFNSSHGGWTVGISIPIGGKK